MKVSTRTCTVQHEAGCEGASGTDSGTCTTNGGTWYASDEYGFDAATHAEVVCAYNRTQQWLTATGGTSGTTTGVSVGSASGMQTNMGILYQLLLNLTATSGTHATYNKNYEDPVERTVAANYTEVGRNDATFKKETEDMKQAIDDLIEAHGGTGGTGGMRSAIAGHTFSSAFSNNTGVRGKTYVQCITGATAGTGASAGVKSVENELGTYRAAIKYRIREISNRIGYLNGKDSGFTGYSFNNGTGYANTVYAHANFLSGKKIKLLAKILSAVEDVDQVYTQITSKRSEYYEYNQ